MPYKYYTIYNNIFMLNISFRLQNGVVCSRMNLYTLYHSIYIYWDAKILPNIATIKVITIAV